MNYWQILAITILLFISGLNGKTMANTNNISTQNQPAIGISRELAQLRAKVYSDIRYNLSFDLRAKKETISGQVRVDLKIARLLQPLVIDFKGLGRLPDQINGKLKTQTIQVNGKSISNFQQINGHIVIPIEAIREGQNSLDIEFETPVEKSGAAITRYIDKDDNGEYLYTLFVP
ncbi:MAG: aminopeptidase N, partial [bacterium]